MSRIFICGLGAVSPAGWGVPSLRAALEADLPLPTEAMAGPARPRPLRARAVPVPSTRPAFLAHPRLRRTSPITHYAAAAAVEAFGSFGAGNPTAGSPVARRLGLICCFQSGCVQYSCRFFEEVIKDPATASPLAFPETVFAAPTSHVATLLGNVELVSSVIGDPASYLQGLALAATWLGEAKVDLAIIVGAEESHWLLADALWQFQHGAVISSGAGAICLSRDPAFSMGVELKAITDAHTFCAASDRVRAARAMRAQLPEGAPGELLCDGLDSSPRADKPERTAWSGWAGARLSPKRILGEGLAAAAAWQCVAACDAVARGAVPAANVSVVGCNQQAIGARFVRSG